MDNNSVQIIEDTKDLDIKNAIIGFPDVGLVGLISCMHIIENLDLKEQGHIESDLFPPIIVLHGKKFQSPVRIYSKGDTTVIISEIPIPPEVIYPLSKALVKWLKTKKNLKSIVSIYGIPIPNRINVETPEVFANSNNPSIDKNLKQKEIKPIDTGILAGMHAAIIWESVKLKVPVIALGCEAFLNYPDPQAAANVIENLNKILNLEIDTKELIDKAEELRIKLRDMMIRTQEAMPKQIPGITPVDLPAMYG